VDCFVWHTVFARRNERDLRNLGEDKSPHRDGRSDKVYQIHLDRVDSGHIVNFQFGRRGSTLQSGMKTPQPLPFENAAKVYNLLLTQKIAMG
jgi:bifunctional non-homologous end joining protein LigD